MDEITEILNRAREQQRFHHAYLLSGPEGASKELCVQKFAAQHFSEPGASSLFGEVVSVSSEQVLKKIQEGGHPDFVWIQPIDDKIAVDAIRELPRILAFSPLEAPFRIVMISGAEKMAAQAANALLKILEEPPHHTNFFLLTEKVDLLLPTILSRCQNLRFFPLADTAVAAWARGESIPEAEIPLFVHLSGGSLSRAKQLAKMEGYPKFCFEAAKKLLLMWAAAPRIPSAAVDWLESLETEAYVDEIPNIWLSVIRDILLGKETFAMHWPSFQSDFLVITQKQSKAELLEQISGKIDAIHRYRVQRDFHGNFRLDLVSLLCGLQISGC